MKYRRERGSIAMGMMFAGLAAMQLTSLVTYETAPMGLEVHQPLDPNASAFAYGRLMTWNIHKGSTVYGNSNYYQVLDTVKKIDPKIGCFQEIPDTYISPLQTLFPGATIVFSPNRKELDNLDTRRFGNAILTQIEAKNALDWKWDFDKNRPTRSAVYAKTDELAVLNTHLESHNSKLRGRQGKELAKLLKKLMPNFLCGDINEFEGGPTRQQILGMGYALADCTDGRPSIDAIYVSNNTTLISCSSPDTGSVSDHAPLVAEMAPS